MFTFSSRLVLVLIFAGMVLLSLTACQSTRPYAASPPTDEDGRERNHGYALLYATIESEAQVDQVLMIKNPRDEVKELLRRIGEFARDAQVRLDRFAEDDDALGYDEHGLPHAEAKTRDEIEKSTSRQIITSGGRNFEHRILLTQYEALNYIRHLAGVVAGMDDDESRRELLAEIRESAASLLEEVLELLRDPYVNAGET